MVERAYYTYRGDNPEAGAKDCENPDSSAAHDATTSVTCEAAGRDANAPTEADIDAALERAGRAPKPDVSVILPIYNAGAYLDQALDSVSEQSLRNIEIICINDGSTDDSLEIMRLHAAQDARIRIIDKKNAGYGAGCNRGLNEAHGRYIAIVEPDDWVESNMLADMLTLADSFNQPIDIVKTPYWRIWMPDTPEQRKINCSYRGRIKPATQPFTIHDPGVTHLLCHHPSIWSAIYRTDFLRAEGIRFHEIPGAGWADNPFLYDTLLRAKTIAYLDQPFYCYREETPEKTKSFATNNTLVPFERWNDIRDVVDALGETDENILRALNERGFTYLGGVLDYVPIEDPALNQAAKGIFARMDDALVFGDAKISNSMKELYAQLKGVQFESDGNRAYLANLVSEGLYNLKNTGPAMTLTTLKGFLKK